MANLKKTHLKLVCGKVMANMITKDLIRKLASHNERQSGKWCLTGNLAPLQYAPRKSSLSKVKL